MMTHISYCKLLTCFQQCFAPSFADEALIDFTHFLETKQVTRSQKKSGGIGALADTSAAPKNKWPYPYFLTTPFHAGIAKRVLSSAPGALLKSPTLANKNTLLCSFSCLLFYCSNQFTYTHCVSMHVWLSEIPK